MVLRHHLCSASRSVSAMIRCKSKQILKDPLHGKRTAGSVLPARPRPIFKLAARCSRNEFALILYFRRRQGASYFKMKDVSANERQQCKPISKTGAPQCYSSVVAMVPSQLSSGITALRREALGNLSNLFPRLDQCDDCALS